MTDSCHRWSDPAINPLLLSAGIITLVTAPQPAFALSNPFSVIIGINLAWQLVAALVLIVPLWVAKKRTWYRVLPPGVKRTVSILLGALAVLVVHFGIPERMAERSGKPLSSSYDPACRPLGHLADGLGLRPSDVLVDVRLPRQYRMYHVEGTCNIDPRRLLRDPALREEIEGTGDRVFLVAEWRRTLSDLYVRLLASGASDTRWKILESGVLFFKLNSGAASSPVRVETVSTGEEMYRTREDVLALFTDNPNPMLVYEDTYRLSTGLTRMAQGIIHRGGPKYQLGWSVSIIGEHPDWRQRPLTFLFNPDGAEATKVYVWDDSFPPRISQAEFPGSAPVIETGRVGTSIEELDSLNGSRIGKILFLCDNGFTCPAAESLALDFIDRGDQVLGYALPMTVSFEPFEKVQSITTVENRFGLRWILLAVVLALYLVMYRIAIRYSDRALIRNGNGFARQLPALGARLLSLGLVVVLWLVSKRVFESLVPITTDDVLSSYLLDAERLGYRHWLLMVPVAYLGSLKLAYDTRPRFAGRGIRYLYATAALLFLAGVGILLVAYVETVPTVFDTILLVSLLYTPSAWKIGGEIANSRWPTVGSDPAIRVLPLEYAARLSCAGQKSRWLAQAMSCGLHVPPGYLVVTGIDRFQRLAGTEEGVLQLEKALRPIRRFLGNQRLIVRSSAPDEDRPGEASAGRYTSVADVQGEELVPALLSVLESYEREGVPGTETIAIIVQVQVAGRYIGVASREGKSKCRSILVEASDRGGNRVTSGQGATKSGRIGAASQVWISGNLDSAELPERNIEIAFAVLERKFGHPMMIEWCWNGDCFFVLQARRAFLEDDRPTPISCGGVLDRLLPGLRIYRHRPEAIVLDSSELTDYQYGASTATKDLIVDMYRKGLAGIQVGGRTFRWLAASGPRPSVIPVEGGLYMNRVASRFLLNRLVRPLVRMKSRTLKLGLRRKLDALSTRIRRTQDRLIALQDTSEVRNDQGPAWRAKQMLQFREKLLNGPVRDLFDAVALRDVLGGSSGVPPSNVDPYLTSLARNDGFEDISSRFPYRGDPEYALEFPRQGEWTSNRQSLPFAAYEENRTHFVGSSTTDVATRVHLVVAGARDSLSFWIALLRRRYVELGCALEISEMGVFDLDLSVIQQIASGEIETPAKALSVPALEDLPIRFSLRQLERRSTGEFLSDPGKPGSYWISGGQTILGTVVPEMPLQSACDYGSPIWVVTHPSVRIVSRATPGVVVVSLGGNRLCHGAMVLREKGIAALFGAEAYQSVLRPGTRIRIDEGGRIEALPGGTDPGVSNSP